MKSRVLNSTPPDIGIPEELLRMLPYRLSDAIRRELRYESIRLTGCEEIRIRKGRMSCLSMSGGINIPLDVSLSREEMEETVSKLCGGSMYAHSETIKKGYISLEGGIRAGVSGRAAVENGRILGVSDINGICIRLPRFVNADVSPIIELLQSFNYTCGVLIYSPPGVGKTTVLRCVAAELSRGRNSVRAVVVDSRGELEFGLRSRYLCTDILSGYPKSEGIEIALRTMGARLIICDEIGNEDEVPSICNAANGGAALVASSHASDMEGLMSKANIKELHRNGVFGAYIKIKRNEIGQFSYDVTLRKDAEDFMRCLC